MSRQGAKAQRNKRKLFLRSAGFLDAERPQEGSHALLCDHVRVWEPAGL